MRHGRIRRIRRLRTTDTVMKQSRFRARIHSGGRAATDYCSTRLLTRDAIKLRSFGRIIDAARAYGEHEASLWKILRAIITGK